MLKVKEAKRLSLKTAVKKRPFITNALSLAGVVIASVFAANSHISGYLSFLNVSVMTLSGVWGVFSFLSSALFYIITGMFKKSFVQLGAMVIILTLKLAFNKKMTPFQETAVTAVSLMFCSIAVSAAMRTSVTLFVYRIFFSVVSSAVVYFVLKLKEEYYRSGRIDLNGLSGAYVGITYMLIISSLCSAELFALNFGRAAGVFSTLVLAKKFRIAGGGICGALTSFAVIVYSPQLAQNTLFLCACGVVGGAFSAFGKIPLIAGFCLSSVMGLVATGVTSDSYAMFTDIAAAAAMYAALPDEAEEGLYKLLAKKSGHKNNSIGNLCSQLEITSSVISNIQKHIEDISTAVEKHSRDESELHMFEREKYQRELLCEQLVVTKCMIQDISQKAYVLSETDWQLTKRAEELFGRYTSIPVKVCVFSDENSNVCVEAFLSDEPDFDMVKFTVALGETLEAQLDMPAQATVNGEVKLTFNSSAMYRILSGTVQKSATDEDCCGDTVERMWLTGSLYAVILSDGMGTGKRARLDSSFCVNIMSRFMATGISPQTAIKFINSVLRVKGWDESFATVDVLLVDMCVGNATFIKSGAAPSYIIRDGNIIKIESRSFPLGILREASPSVIEHRLFENDRIVVASDGLTEKAVRLAAEEMKKHDLNPKQLAEISVGFAKENNAEIKTDDISVCVLRVFDK